MHTSERFRRWLIALVAVSCVLGFAAIVVAADRGALPNVIRRLYDWPGGDKVGHVVLLAIVTCAVTLALHGRRVRIGPWTMPLGSMLVAVAITLEEASQGWVPGRTLSLADLACSYLGIYIGTWLGNRVAVTRTARIDAAPSAVRRTS